MGREPAQPHGLPASDRFGCGAPAVGVGPVRGGPHRRRPGCRSADRRVARDGRARRAVLARRRRVSGSSVPGRYRHDLTYSCTWAITSAPLGDVQSGDLARLPSAHREITRKRVTLLYAPVDAARAASIVESDRRGRGVPGERGELARGPLARDQDYDRLISSTSTGRGQRTVAQRLHRERIPRRGRPRGAALAAPSSWAPGPARP
ncbi:SCO6880 family protein [Cellulosimicrobium sp. Marseille-Q8652]